MERATGLTENRSKSTRARAGESARESSRGTADQLLSAPPGSLAERASAKTAGWHPAARFAVALLSAFAVFGVLSIGVGYLVTHVLLDISGVSSTDERAVTSLVGHRSSGLTDVSAAGSAIAGGLVLPVLVGSLALYFAIRRRWQLAAYVVFALAVESALYRVTTIVIHRHRPDVARLEQLPVNASYPSGHTAASVAVYVGLALLLSARAKGTRYFGLVWMLALLIPVFVAGSRMYRGMHHPIDTLAGAGVGLLALTAVIFACRVTNGPRRAGELEGTRGAR